MAADLQVEGNLVYRNARAGLRINGGDAITVRGNAILHNLQDGKTRQSEIELQEHGDEGPRNVLVEANHVAATRRAAVMDAHRSEGTRIEGNVYSARGRGIVLRARSSIAEDNTRLRVRHWNTARDPLSGIA